MRRGNVAGRMPPRRRLRLRDQAQHPAAAGGARLPCHGRAGATPAAAALALQPDGIFLSNGPGDPAAVTSAIDAVRELLGACRSSASASVTRSWRWPWAADLQAEVRSSRRQPAGEHAPTAAWRSPPTTTTSPSTPLRCPPDVEVTHVNLNDGCCEGLRHRPLPAFERPVPPREPRRGRTTPLQLFDEFVAMMAAGARRLAHAQTRPTFTPS